MAIMKKSVLFLILMTALLAAIGCGGSTGPKTNPVSSQGLVDPSGNWRMSFTDSTQGDLFILAGLFSQTGATVTGINFFEVGNLAPGFQCLAQRDIALSNGIVQNVNQFSGTLTGNFGTITFTSTLNDAGTHAAGTYVVTPGAAGNCLGIALTGTFTSDEVPSVSGNWSGTIECIAGCPIGSTTGTITLALTQNDDTDVVNGTYIVSGLPGLSNGSIVPNTIPQNNFISGANIEEQMLDANGNTVTLAGGPFNSGFHAGGTFQDTGVGLDRSMAVFLIENEQVYTVNATH